MTIPWIQVYSNMVTHNKTRRLAGELKLTSKEVKPNVIAAGMLLALWSWAAQNAADGNLTGIPVEDIADVAGWRKDPQLFYDALVKVGLLDVGEEGVQIHDWMVYSQLLHEQSENKKEKDRARSKAYRDRKKRASQESQPNHGYEITPNNRDASHSRHGDDNVTNTQESQPNHASTIPYHTIPNHISNEDRRIGGDSISNEQRDDCVLPASESWEEMKQRIDSRRRMQRSE